MVWQNALGVQIIGAQAVSRTNASESHHPKRVGVAQGGKPS